MAGDGLTLVQAVRRRPAMYVGNTTDGSGIQHMIFDAIQRALLRRCTRIHIELAANGTITVEDDAPGWLPPLEPYLTRWPETSHVDNDDLCAPLEHMSIGLFVINALSERLEVCTARDGIASRVVGMRGEVGAVATEPTQMPDGTRLRFDPDPQIFAHTRVWRGALAERLEDLSFLIPDVQMSWSFAGDDAARGGLAARVALATPCRLEGVARHRAAYDTPRGRVTVDVALAWRSGDGESNREPWIDSFVNASRTRNHGTHVDGLLGATEQRHRGLVAAVSVIDPRVKLSADRSRAENPELREPVAAATRAALATHT